MTTTQMESGPKKRHDVKVVSVDEFISAPAGVLFFAYREEKRQLAQLLSYKDGKMTIKMLTGPERGRTMKCGFFAKMVAVFHPREKAKAMAILRWTNRKSEAMNRPRK